MNSEGVRKTLDRLAYASLIIDVCIALITGLTVLDARLTSRLLIPIDYLLSVVVILSAALFVLLLVLKTKERRSFARDQDAGSERGSS